LWQVPRLLRIAATLVRYRLDDLVESTHLFRPLRWLRPLLPRPRANIANLARGARLREALIELGPIFVKAGQILSTRRDLLPDDIANELAMLQDRVPPFPGSVARTLEKIAREFRPDFEEAFARTFGDVAGVALARAFSGAFAFARESAQALAQDTAEFLREESRDLIAPAEIDTFLDDVDALRESAERLEARIGRIVAGT
jgi:ubiquinone biosynthesis protein